jgi:hypothetical protein
MGEPFQETKDEGFFLNPLDPVRAKLRPPSVRLRDGKTLDSATEALERILYCQMVNFHSYPASNASERGRTPASSVEPLHPASLVEGATRAFKNI